MIRCTPEQLPVLEQEFFTWTSAHLDSRAGSSEVPSQTFMKTHSF